MDTIQDRNQLSQDGFKWFPRCLPDNCVEYMLFVLDSQLEPRSLLAELENVRDAAMQLCAEIAKDYIWQRDSFQLQIKREDGLVYLHGTTDYGDSIEDEWLIVYLLRRLTNAFPSLWVRVFDSDGEFLLIAAAKVVPKWLNPEIDSNRAWIHQGKLQLVPMSVGFGAKRPLSLAEAVQFITLQPVALLHSPFIEAEAFYRLEKYPEIIKSLLHHSVITIPRKLAYILHEQPAAIAPAIESFYLRDAVTLKPLSASPSELHFPPTDLVTVSVRFTKVLFAQVKSQQFAAPPSWSTFFQALEQGGVTSEQEQETAARLELGMKVTSGFEMLAASAYAKHNRLAREFAIFLEHVEEEGDQALPSDEDIAKWPCANKDDNETWLDINFEDFENELQGNQRPKTGQKNGFGDAKTQADLRKIVSQFEDFLNDDSAGFEGAELDDMDRNNDSSEQTAAGDDDDNDESSEDEDKAVSFDETQFDKMMNEMMGLPASKSEPPIANPQDKASDKVDGGVEEDDEAAEIGKLSAQMEAELKGHGALTLDEKSKKSKTGEEGGDDEVDIDYNLAKNLLDSFKGQEGLAGPAGNMIGMMGMKLPRDEGDGEEDETEDNGKRK